MKVILLCLLLAAGPKAQAAASTTEVRVDVNAATTTELMTVPGMTLTWARRIVRFRPYKTKLDLLEQGVVSADAYQRIKDRVVAHRTTGFSAHGPATPAKP